MTKINHLKGSKSWRLGSFGFYGNLEVTETSLSNEGLRLCTKDGHVGCSCCEKGRLNANHGWHSFGAPFDGDGDE